MFSNQFKFYKDLFFSIFNIIKTENKVSAKYKTKNIKTDCIEVFLATKNQSSAIIISSRNLRLMATRLYNVWLSGSLVCPLINIKSVINELSEKADERMIISVSVGVPFPEGIKK
jgi:hypothetical protein